MSLILDLIFPKSCYGCGRQAGYLCPDCIASLQSKPIRPFKSSSPLESCLSLYSYRGFLKRAIVDYKYGFVSDLAYDLAKLMSATLTSDYPNLITFWRSRRYVLTPVPLHWQRLNWRGFNQSSLLATLLASTLQLDCHPILLCRNRSTSPQALLGSSPLRLTNISGSIHLNTCCPPSNIILVDDVATTHSTLQTCAAVLRRNSCNSVCGLTLAGGQ